MLWELKEYVEGQSVALVGNSSKLLRLDPPAAARIDGHDIVIRMNMGVPSKVDATKIGMRTDIWATAKYFPVHPPLDIERILWMKLTKMGNRQFEAFYRDFGEDFHIDRWPKPYEIECRQFVGADPGTGIRLLWWLKTKANPRSVSVYGMDCWEQPSHWSGRRNTPNHKPDLEREAMMKLL